MRAILQDVYDDVLERIKTFVKIENKYSYNIYI